MSDISSSEFYDKSTNKYYKDVLKNFKFAEDIKNSLSYDYLTSLDYQNYSCNRTLFKLPRTNHRANQSSISRLEKFYQINGRRNSPRIHQSQKIPVDKMKIKKLKTSFNGGNTAAETKNNNEFYHFHKEEIRKLVKHRGLKIETPIPEPEDVDLSALSLGVVSDLFSICPKERGGACRTILERNLDTSQHVQEKLMNIAISDPSKDVRRLAVSILKREKTIKSYQKYILSLLRSNEGDRRTSLMLLCPEVLNDEISELFRKSFRDGSFIVRKLSCAVCGDHEEMIEHYFAEISHVCKNDVFECVRREALLTLLRFPNKIKLSNFISKFILFEENDDFVGVILAYFENTGIDDKIRQFLVIRKGLGNEEINKKIDRLLTRKTNTD